MVVLIKFSAGSKASHGMTDMAHFLISKNVDVNARDYEFMTPLHVAAEYFAV